MSDKRHKYYFKVLNHDLFGGEGTEGFIKLAFEDKQGNPKAIARMGLTIGSTQNVEYIEITEEEYIENTEE